MPLRVAVIGAGMAGLCALRHLSSNPEQFEPVAFEQSKDIGGVWVYSDIGDDKVDGCLYKTLRTNIPKEIMGFPDFDFPDYDESFLHHSAIRNYLEDYAAYFDLTKFIQFQALVKHVAPTNGSADALANNDMTSHTGSMMTSKNTHSNGIAKDEDGEAANNNGHWHVTVQDLKTGNYSTLVFDAIVICNGLNNVPNMPILPGQDQFQGDILHSKHYRDPEHYRDKTVVILGASFSGKDILMDLAHVAKHVYISHRSKCKLKFKLPTNAEEKPMITRILPDGIQFEGDDKKQADVIIFATGYLLNYPFLSDTCQISVRSMRVQPLHRQILNVHFPTMCFIGLTSPVLQFKMVDAQVQYACAVLRGDVISPTEKVMLKEEEEEFLERCGSAAAPRRIHQLLGQEQWDYADVLAKEAGFPSIPMSNRKLFKYLTELFQYEFDNVKNKKFFLTDHENFICL